MKTFLSCVCLVLLIASSARADRAAAVLSPGGPENNADNDGPFTIGFTFRVNGPITMTAVGAFDSFGDGLINPHDVALYLTDGTELYSTTVPAGNSITLIDRFRYVPVSGWDLTPGTDYIIAASNFGDTGDHYLSRSAVPQAAGGVRLFSSRSQFTPDGSLAFPTRDSGFFRASVFGANFRYLPVPEPTALGLGIIASAALLGFRRHPAQRQCD